MLDAPGATVPVSNVLESPVAVCADASSFLQMTVVPLATVIGVGVKAKFLMSTVTVAGLAAPGEAWSDGAGDDDDPQPAPAATNARDAAPANAARRSPATADTRQLPRSLGEAAMSVPIWVSGTGYLPST